VRHILAAGNRRRLAEIATSRVALVFDFDGTLAPIVDDPARAELRPRTRALLSRAATRFPCAVISGRRREDVARRLSGIDLAFVIGNHGADWGRPSGGGLGPELDERAVEKRVQSWRARLERGLGELAGVMVEDKRYALAIHYRRSREKRRAAEVIAALVSRLPGARVRLGKQVVNLIPEGAPHKGIALEEVRRRLACDTALYAGDDTTDEDVFALDTPGQLLTIRVGPSRASLATYYIEDQMEIDELLRTLLAARPVAAREILA
jgi:trehalose 6-phosphate phosphatase